MFRCLLVLLCFISRSDYLYAQTIPAEGQILNYRLIGFSVQKNTKAVKYLLQISEDSITNENTFQKNIIINSSSASNKLIQTVPAFNKKYTWQVTCFDKDNKILSKTGLLHFKTGYCEFIDTSKYRIRIITDNTNDTALLFFSDNTRTLNNLKGETVWYMPEIQGVNTKVRIRDLKLTPDATITFLTDSDACEINYSGKLLWRAPRFDVANGNFHHEFTKLKNGHYMVEGYETIVRTVPKIFMQYLDRSDVILKDEKFIKQIQCGTLVEFNPAKKMVWHWKCSEHFTDTDYFRLVAPGAKPNSDTHMNGFYFDEKNNFIYISFREISRIMKIKYPTGNVVAQYGDNYAGNTNGGGNFFHAQHHCSINSAGDLCLFNNNHVNKNGSKMKGKPVSYVTILEEPKNNKDSISLKWEFPCDIDTLAGACAETGGSVYELSNHNMLVSMGSVHRFFIVTPQKQVIWNSLTEMKTENNGWVQFAGYRANPVEGKPKIQKLIFSNL